MSAKKNILWIMTDQLRWDYLSCTGHPHLHTPNIDSLAERGVRFSNVYVQSPICGPSRMSSYTGRYCRSHGATWNGFPLRVDEPTLANHLRDIGVLPAIVGKTHMKPDLAGMKRLGIDPDSEIGVNIAQCGFEPFERDDGMHPWGPFDPEARYNDYLESHGLTGDSPWERYANTVVDTDGTLKSGWFLENSHLPANIAEEHSETPYMTRRAIDFMEQAGDQPWMCHLSFIKPHWPYVVPAPYNDMYGPDDVLQAVRSEKERENPHPVFGAYMDSRVCSTFAREEVRQRVIPPYMGLVKQIDDQMGVLFSWMEEQGLMDNTMIVFTSDHGDYLGDHWMGEKDLFHDQSVKVPLIVYDPRPEADATRGTVRDELIEAIDMAPTFLSYFGGSTLPHILEGKNIEPLLHDPATPADWRRYAISEYDYATREAREILGVPQQDARLIMVRDERWKFIHAEGFRPMLFDLQEDPDELTDLGDSGDALHVETRARMEAALAKWTRQHHNRFTVPPEQLAYMQTIEPTGVIIGFWDEQEYEDTFGEPFVAGTAINQTEAKRRMDALRQANKETSS